MLTLVEIIARNCEKSGVAQYDDRYPTVRDVSFGRAYLALSGCLNFD